MKPSVWGWGGVGVDGGEAMAVGGQQNTRQFSLQNLRKKNVFSLFHFPVQLQDPFVDLSRPPELSVLCRMWTRKFLDWDMLDTAKAWGDTMIEIRAWIKVCTLNSRIPSFFFSNWFLDFWNPGFYPVPQVEDWMIPLKGNLPKRKDLKIWTSEVTSNGRWNLHYPIASPKCLPMKD